MWGFERRSGVPSVWNEVKDTGSRAASGGTYERSELVTAGRFPNYEKASRTKVAGGF